MNTQEHTSFVRLFGEHSFRLVTAAVSISYFYASALGFFYEWTLLAQFGVNDYTAFVGLPDFFMAAVKRWHVLATIPIISILFVSTFGGFKAVKAQWNIDRPLVLGMASAIVIAPIIMPFITAKEQASSYKWLNRPVVVISDSPSFWDDNSNKLVNLSPPSSIITTTSRNLFLWNPLSGRLNIIPTSKVLNVVYLPNSQSERFQSVKVKNTEGQPPAVNDHMK